MTKKLILLSIPGLREKDVAVMPRLRELTAGGEIADLVPSFPSVTCCVQANMTTGCLPREHGVVANGFYWRKSRQVEMWTSPSDCIQRPQIWDILAGGPHPNPLPEGEGTTGGPHPNPLPEGEGTKVRSAVWFPLHSKGCQADYVCTPAPIHNPDGTESLWCYTRPPELYGTLRDRLGHFPLKNFWGPLAGVQASRWIADSAAVAAEQWQPDFFYIYLPHLDYAAQRNGPESVEADVAVAELDEVIGQLAGRLGAAYGEGLLWLVAGEYAITPVNHVAYPNRLLREAGLLAVRDPRPASGCPAGGEELDLEASRAWAMVDHQFSHVFVSGGDPALAQRVAEVFRGQPGIAEVLLGEDLARYGLDHPRSGEVVLISEPRSWQAYYWWLSDDRAPAWARTVDIHRKPGYDPVELCFDPASRGIPLEATRIKGSHGAPAVERAQRSVLLASEPIFLPGVVVADTEVFGVVLRHFGLQS
ncbi:MAG: alkaline phosphatase family protein [Thermoguttaceae bacterium]